MYGRSLITISRVSNTQSERSISAFRDRLAAVAFFYSKNIIGSQYWRFLVQDNWPNDFAGTFDWISALIALVAAIALFRFKRNVIEVITVCAIMGLILKTFL